MQKDVAKPTISKAPYSVTLPRIGDGAIIRASVFCELRSRIAEHAIRPVCGGFARQFSACDMENEGIATQLDLLRDKILLLGGKTEAAVNRAMSALTTRNSDLARAVVAEDELIDQMELEIDQLSIEILASQRPTEHDLRLVVSVAKITPILERIADHATSIAETAIILNNEPQINNYIDFSKMAAIASGMLSEALNAFTSEDATASREIIVRDQELDRCYSRVFDDLLEIMKNPAASSGAARLLFVAKHIERIGDYVKDICELNVYLREAVFIKHSVQN